MGRLVPPELGAEIVPVARHAAQRDAEQALAQAPAVEGRGVDEVHAEVEGHVDRAEGLVEIDRAEFLPQRRGAEAQRGQLQARIPQRSELHSIMPRKREWDPRTRA